ncbi:MAG: hypothetical protein ACKOJF_29970, partial [Planctomycetaceae bacterium]
HTQFGLAGCEMGERARGDTPQRTTRQSSRFSPGRRQSSLPSGAVGRGCLRQCPQSPWGAIAQGECGRVAMLAAL